MYQFVKCKGQTNLNVDHTMDTAESLQAVKQIQCMQFAFTCICERNGRTKRYLGVVKTCDQDYQMSRHRQRLSLKVQKGGGGILNALTVRKKRNFLTRVIF